MRRLRILLASLMFSSFSALAGVQPMLALPTSMNYLGSTEVVTLCLGSLQMTPTALDALGKFVPSIFEPPKWVQDLEKGEVSFHGVDNPLRMRLMKDGENVSGESGMEILQPMVISEDKVSFSTKFMDFVDRKVQEYNKPGFDKSQHVRLQHEVWDYEWLEKMGYLSISEQEDVDAAHEAFFKDFRSTVKEVRNLFLRLKKKGSENLVLNITQDGEFQVFSPSQFDPIVKVSDVELLLDEIERLNLSNQASLAVTNSFSRFEKETLLLAFSERDLNIFSYSLKFTEGAVDLLSTLRENFHNVKLSFDEIFVAYESKRVTLKQLLEIIKAVGFDEKHFLKCVTSSCAATILTEQFVKTLLSECVYLEHAVIEQADSRVLRIKVLPSSDYLIEIDIPYPTN